ncbi:MAG: 50S ribosomal protein L25/general stress protein Ctc [Rickettsiales bacterium]|nr:50S ribosomal protein L25/general stress protein Ctc [Rickettsiales bacterium]
MTNAKQNATLSAELRETHGKGPARALRREGKIPAILYSKTGTPVSIALKQTDVTQEYQRGRFRSRLIDIKLGGKDVVKALPKDLQFHPVTDVIEHVDFIRVEPGSQIRVMVPVKFVGQDKSLGLKRGGVLNVVRHEIEFICPAEAIPQHIEVNLQEMNIGDSVHIESIALPKDVTPVIKRNFTVATIAGRTKEEEPAAVAATAAAAPAAGAAAAPAADAKKEDAKPAAKK